MIAAATIAGGAGLFGATVISDSSESSTNPRITRFCSEFVPLMETSNLYAKWASQNRGERDQWLTYRATICLDQQPAMPTMATAFGKALVSAGQIALELDVPPGTTTAGTTTATTGTTVTDTVGTTTVAQPGNPYFLGDFHQGDYQAFNNVFTAYGGSNPNVLTWGGMPGRPNQWNDPVYPGAGQDIHNPALRMALVRDPLGVRPGWVSRHEVRMSDPPWTPDASTLDKSSLQTTALETWGGPFTMGIERWFGFSVMLPNTASEKFWWVEGSNWLNTWGLHTGPSVGYAPNQVEVRRYDGTYAAGHPRWLGFVLEGATEHSDFYFVPLVQLTNADGSRFTGSYNRWHRFVFGARFTDRPDGWREIYKDGVLVLPRTAGANTRTGDTGQYLMHQMYKLHAAPWASGANSSVLYYADIRIGRAAADVR